MQYIKIMNVYLKKNMHKNINLKYSLVKHS